MRVADEDDALDPGRRPLVDLEHEIDPVLLERDDLGIDRGREAGIAPVEVEDALDVALHLRSRVDDARPKLDFLLQGLVVELVVPLERDPVDDRVLDHADDECVALAPQRHIGEETGREEGLERAVDPLGVVGIAGLDREIRADGLRLDPLRALDLHLADDLAALCESRPDEHGQKDECRGDNRPPSLTFNRPLVTSASAAQLKIGRRTMSFQVANTIKVRTSASPIRNPYSCARWPSGRPRIASAA